ncbi:MAG TPA: hypothetical protein VGS03_18750 [Candidatus Polarisedimenticolia bacterium]|jgi:hypothetical protein|nr:hypothetical protein [Candidatus Polarisedimenticolia bacterium]
MHAGHGSLTVPRGVTIGRGGTQTAGTAACLVTRASDRPVAAAHALFLLGTNHILALVNRGPIGAPIRRPGSREAPGHRGRILARLSSFVPISFDSANVVDAALARTSAAVLDRRLPGARGARGRLRPPVVAPAIGMLVQKTGGMTGHRRGRIDAVGVTVKVDYTPLGRTARFENQFRVRGIDGVFSDRGDSGALVTTWPGNQPVGLLFAGNAAANVAFCNDIGTVCRRLGVSILF